MLPSTLPAPARLWLHHRTHDSPARTPLLLTCAPLTNRNQQTSHEVTPPTTSQDVRDVSHRQPHPAAPVEQHRAWEWLNSSCNSTKAWTRDILILREAYSFVTSYFHGCCHPWRNIEKLHFCLQRTVWTAIGWSDSKRKKEKVPECSNITKEDTQGFQPFPFGVLGYSRAEEFREPHLFQG